MQADLYASSNAPSLGSNRPGSPLFEFCFLVRGGASVGCIDPDAGISPCANGLSFQDFHNSSFKIDMHCSDIIMGAILSQIRPTSVYSTVYWGADKNKTSKLRVTDLCAGNSSLTGEFPAQMASNAETFSIWWRHHVIHRNIQSQINKLIWKQTWIVTDEEQGDTYLLTHMKLYERICILYLHLI